MKKEEKAIYNKEYRKLHKEEQAIYAKEYRKLHKEEQAIYNKAYQKSHKEQHNAYCKEYRKNYKEEIAAYKKEYFRKYKKNNPEKIKAHNILNHTVDRGDIIRQPCSKCGKAKAEAHHPDYTKPLDVIWLCSSHHRNLHAELNNIN